MVGTLLRAAANRLQHARARLRGRWRALWEHLPHYIVDGANWSIDSDGEYICREVSRQFGIQCRLERGLAAVRFLHGQILHFGSLHLFAGGGYGLAFPDNKVVVTVFHGDPSDPSLGPSLAILRRERRRIDKVVVSCRIMQERMRSWGMEGDLVARIPIGVDLALFRPPSPGEREAKRSRLGIPDGCVVIGSFQKDGVGWEEGLEPKLIKGPDIFLRVIERLKGEIPVFVLLTGPARGYVIQGLERMRVPYTHALVDSYAQMAQHYFPLDVYLVASREEGGPKGVPESMATGVPIVSTRVGMALDLIQDGTNGFLCRIEDVEGLATRVLDLVGRVDLRERFKENGLRTATSCDFKQVARLYYERVYAPLLGSLDGSRGR